MNGYVVGSLCINEVRDDAVPAFTVSAVVRIRTPMRLLLVFVWLFSCVGCQSSLDPDEVTDLAEDSPFSQTQGQVTAAVRPWMDRGEVKRLFGVDLLSKHILPIQVVIANQGEETIRFSSTQAEFIYGEGVTSQVIGEAEMTRRTQKNTTTGPFLIYIATLTYGAGIAGAWSEGLEDDNMRDRRTRHDTALSIITLDAQERMCGFLFFDIPREIKLKESPLNGTVVIKRVPVGSGENLAFSIPVSVE